MFHPDVIAAKLQATQAESLGLSQPLERLPVETCLTYTAQLSDVYDEDGTRTRPLTADEEAFIGNERFLCPIDFRYWAERYVLVDKEAAALTPLYPLWRSQELILEEIARVEYTHWVQSYPDGILINILKARQLGASTLCQAILAHRVLLYPHVKALTAADVEEQTGHLFTMLDRIEHYLPWWLRPVRLTRVKHRELSWQNGSIVKTAWGKSMRGGLQDQGGVKGNLGRGKTYSAVHISELSTWERGEQLDDALMPGIPQAQTSFCAFESTAKGRHNYWHQAWLKADKGLGRFTNVFIPWYAVATKYWLPAPADWTPSGESLAHATKAESIGPRFLHRPVSLTRDQLYWYERERASYEADPKRGLAKFLEEYAADDEECFQHTGRSIFPIQVQQRVLQQSIERGGMKDFLLIEPKKDLAQLQAMKASP